MKLVPARANKPCAIYLYLAVVPAVFTLEPDRHKIAIGVMIHILLLIKTVSIVVVVGSLALCFAPRNNKHMKRAEHMRG
eukprot:COSAG05_NODE_2572_length_2885_cov_2.493180_2_plen_79_part_00